jgi:hypothetical protein
VIMTGLIGPDLRREELMIHRWLMQYLRYGILKLGHIPPTVEKQQ